MPEKTCTSTNQGRGVNGGVCSAVYRLPALQNLWRRQQGFRVDFQGHEMAVVQSGRLMRGQRPGLDAGEGPSH